MIFSIIVPVYNIQKWISACIESVLRQTVQDYELILVDDGSVDRSGLICDEYADKYSQVRVIHKINGGVSDARNSGVDVAIGDYILFLDGDDYIAEWTLGELRKIIEEKSPDVILSEGLYYVSEDKCELAKFCDKKDIQGLYGSDALFLASKKYDIWSPYDKCFKRIFWQANHFAFKVGRRIGEDFQLIYRVILEAYDVYMISPFYYYQARNDSAMHSIDGKMLEEMLENFRDWERYFATRDLDSELKKQLYKAFARQLCLVIMQNIHLVDKGIRNEVAHAALEFVYFLEYNKTKEYALIQASIKILGMKRACYLLRLASRLKLIKM